MVRSRAREMARVTSRAREIAKNYILEQATMRFPAEIRPLFFFQNPVHGKVAISYTVLMARLISTKTNFTPKIYTCDIIILKRFKFI